MSFEKNSSCQVLASTGDFCIFKKKEEKKKLRKPARIFLKLPAVFVFALRLAFNTFSLQLQSNVFRPIESWLNCWDISRETNHVFNKDLHRKVVCVCQMPECLPVQPPPTALKTFSDRFPLVMSEFPLSHLWSDAGFHPVHCNATAPSAASSQTSCWRCSRNTLGQNTV